MLGIFVFILTCYKISFGYGNIIPATPAYICMDSQQILFDLIFQREEILYVPGVPNCSIACVINLPGAFACYLDLLNFSLYSGLSCFKVLTICLLLVYFLSAAGCHCFDLIRKSGGGGGRGNK